MNIIKYDDYFSPFITVDNTSITIDNTSITIDTSNISTPNYRLEVIPRRYEVDVEVFIRELFSSNEISFITNAVNENGILYVDFKDFTPVLDNKYEVIIYNLLGDVIWLGQAMYSERDIQNYSSNNSDENNLRF